jgi:hypothetical protein
VPVDALDGDEGSVLHHLCGEIGADERLPILKYLVEDCGADLDTINNYGLTAMNLAHLRGNASLVEYLAPRSRENFMVGFREGRKAQQTGARMFISFIISVKQIRMHSPDAYYHSTQDVMRDFELLGEERLLHADKSSHPRQYSQRPLVWLLRLSARQNMRGVREWRLLPHRVPQDLGLLWHGASGPLQRSIGCPGVSTASQPVLEGEGTPM